MIINYL